MASTLLILIQVSECMSVSLSVGTIFLVLDEAKLTITIIFNVSKLVNQSVQPSVSLLERSVVNLRFFCMLLCTLSKYLIQPVYTTLCTINPHSKLLHLPPPTLSTSTSYFFLLLFTPIFPPFLTPSFPPFSFIRKSPSRCEYSQTSAAWLRTNERSHTWSAISFLKIASLCGWTRYSAVTEEPRTY